MDHPSLHKTLGDRYGFDAGLFGDGDYGAEIIWV